MRELKGKVLGNVKEREIRPRRMGLMGKGMA